MITTRISMVVALIALIAALTFIVAAGTFAATITQAEAKKGEAALHISPQGAAHQSAQGAAASGTGCQALCE